MGPTGNALPCQIQEMILQKLLLSKKNSKNI